MKKTYQTRTAPAATDRLVMPKSVTLTMADLAGTVEEGLLALAVGAGFGVMQVMVGVGKVHWALPALTPDGSEKPRAEAVDSAERGFYRPALPLRAGLKQDEDEDESCHTRKKRDCVKISVDQTPGGWYNE